MRNALSQQPSEQYNSNPRKRQGKKTKAWWIVSSLNMKGQGSQQPEQSKWSEINSMMREKQISLLTLQETRLSDEYTNKVWALYGKRLSIHFSSSTENATGKSGVAVVLNKDLVKMDHVESTKLIPGRVLLIRVPWHGGATFTWLAIYAPNKEAESKEMWKMLMQLWDDLKLPIPDRMSGDFNFVEDAMDRLLDHEDNKAIVEAFQAFHKMLKLQDRWHATNPNTKEYTYTQMAGNFSRSWIDRIYVSNTVVKNCDQWDISNPGMETDHHTVSVKMSSPKAPYVGKGRWSLPLHLLNNGKAIHEVEEIVCEMGKDIQVIAEQRSETVNPQTVYAKGKKDIICILQHYRKRSIPIKQARMESLQAELDAMLQDDKIPEDEHLMSMAIIQQRIQQIRKEVSETRSMSSLVCARLEMETISKYWIKVGNHKVPRDTMQELQQPGSEPPVYVRRSDKMAETA